jgi:hypothetical protein
VLALLDAPRQYDADVSGAVAVPLDPALGSVAAPEVVDALVPEGPAAVAVPLPGFAAMLLDEGKPRFPPTPVKPIGCAAGTLTAAPGPTIIPPPSGIEPLLRPIEPPELLRFALAPDSDALKAAEFDEARLPVLESAAEEVEPIEPAPLVAPASAPLPVIPPAMLETAPARLPPPPISGTCAFAVPVLPKPAYAVIAIVTDSAHAKIDAGRTCPRIAV